jgi:hypothetical protein
MGLIRRQSAAPEIVRRALAHFGVRVKAPSNIRDRGRGGFGE